MNKSKTNVSVVDNVGIRRNIDIIVGNGGAYRSGDILDANATIKLIQQLSGNAAELESQLAQANATISEVRSALEHLIHDAPENMDELVEILNNTYTKEEVDNKIAEIDATGQNPDNYSDDEDIESMFGND